VIELDRDMILESVIRSIDISPSDFQLAQDRYSAVSDWLERGQYRSGNRTDIYLQGSFRLGTVIRPYRGGKDADFDIDQVCEIDGSETTPRVLKQDVGNRLIANRDYERMLDREGRRCWTLQYASSAGRPGFHLDILPSRLSNSESTRIDITHKNQHDYSWLTSNPKGYYEWFKSKNEIGEKLLLEQRQSIHSANQDLYSSKEDVPLQLIRTPLQRSVQLLKRHRDVYCNDRKGRPISIILTTICTHLYQGKSVLDTITLFANYVADRLRTATSGKALQRDGILDFQDGKWFVVNPADVSENFAEKWQSDPQLPECFFAWVYQLQRDVRAFAESTHMEDLSVATFGNGEGRLTYGENLVRSLGRGPVKSSPSFLDLIHQAIERKVAWNQVEKIAVRNIEGEDESSSAKDVAWVNYYQVRVHSGHTLREDELAHIRAILEKYRDRPDFVFCCSTLLGMATRVMLEQCVKSRWEDTDALGWPITRLAKGQVEEDIRVILPVA